MSINVKCPFPVCVHHNTPSHHTVIDSVSGSDTGTHNAIFPRGKRSIGIAMLPSTARRSHTIDCTSVHSAMFLRRTQNFTALRNSYLTTTNNNNIKIHNIFLMPVITYNTPWYSLVFLYNTLQYYMPFLLYLPPTTPIWYFTQYLFSRCIQSGGGETP